MNRIALTIVTIGLICVISIAQETTTTTTSSPATEVATQPATQPTTEPASQVATQATSQPATASAPSPDAEVRKILDDLEQAGKKNRTIRADVVYKLTSAMGGGGDVRTGYVLFQRETPQAPSKFRLHFDTLKQGAGAAVKELQDYAFFGDVDTGQWLVIAEHVNKKLRRIQMSAPGRRIDPLRIGQGPFPLPFGQKADEVQEHFNVTTRPLKAGEPAGTTYLKLVPKREFKGKMSFLQTELWIDPKLNLPIRIASKEKNKDRTLVNFSNIKTNIEIGPENFKLERPVGWKMEVTELQKR